MLRLTISLLSGLLAISAVQADVYKYTDEKGNTLYTDKPLSLPAERLNVQSQRTDTVAVAKRVEEENKRLSEQNKTQQSAAGKAADEKKAQELSATDKAERCAKARERFDNYTNSQRLYEEVNGQRRYLSAEELDAARASAKVSMETLCK